MSFKKWFRTAPGHPKNRDRPAGEWADSTVLPDPGTVALNQSEGVIFCALQKTGGRGDNGGTKMGIRSPTELAFFRPLVILQRKPAG